MKLLPFGRSPALSYWLARDFSNEVLAGPRPTDDRDRHTAIVAKEPPGDPLPDGPFRRVATAIGEYRIFPTTIGDRVLERSPVQVGDTVGLSYRLLPGLRMFIASRVIDVFDERTATGWKAGFTYRTLAGHPELGEETFAVEKNRDSGNVTASLTAWSRPGHWLTRIGYWYARRTQRRAGRAALVNFAEIALGE